jgi:hypothetical protein
MEERREEGGEGGTERRDREMREEWSNVDGSGIERRKDFRREQGEEEGR